MVPHVCFHAPTCSRARFSWLQISGVEIGLSQFCYSMLSLFGRINFFQKAMRRHPPVEIFPPLTLHWTADSAWQSEYFFFAHVMTTGRSSLDSWHEGADRILDHLLSRQSLSVQQLSVIYKTQSTTFMVHTVVGHCTSWTEGSRHQVCRAHLVRSSK